MSKSENTPQVSSDDVNTQFLQQQLLQQQLLLQNAQSEEDEIDLAELWGAIWAGKFIIIFISALFAVSSVFYALSKPDVYKASAILSPVSSEGGAGGLGALAGQFGGLASMAGINLGGSSGGDKTGMALEVLKSRSFIEKFIEKHELLIPLMASKGWDKSVNELIFDEKLYDKKNKKWLEEAPSPWRAYQEFLQLMEVSQDKSTSMVIIDFNFYSPQLAKQWLTWVIADVNEYIRAQDKIEAKTSIDYLTQQLMEIKVASMEAVFYQLIEEQTKNMMLTMVKKEYVLKTIDPAQVPDLKDKPRRALIVILGTILGGLFSVLFILTRYFIKL